MTVDTLQATSSAIGAPSFQELVTHFGPYLGLVLFLIISFLVMQYFWFTRVIRAKDAEIDRLVKHETDLNDRIFKMIDKQIGFKTENKR